MAERFPDSETPSMAPTRPLATPSPAALALAVSLLLSACGGGSAEAPVDPPAPSEPTAEAADAPAPASEPAGLPPLTSRNSGAVGTPMNAVGLSFNLPAEWTAEEPASIMRKAQAVIPGPAGPGQLTVFHFGPGAGGGVESNLQRWAGQVEQDPDTVPLRDQFDNAAGLRVTWIDVQGTLLPSNMGTGPSEPQSGSRLVGAVVEGPGGPWFFKATGPAETLVKGRDALIAMLQAAHL